MDAISRSRSGLNLTGLVQNRQQVQAQDRSSEETKKADSQSPKQEAARSEAQEKDKEIKSLDVEA